MVSPVIKSSRNIKTELQVSSKWVFVALLIFGTVLIVIGDRQINPFRRLAVLQFALLFFIVPGIAWPLEYWRPKASRWFTTIALIVLVHLGIGWLGISEAVIFLTIPIALTVALIGLPGAIAAAIGETVLLLLLPQYIMANVEPTFVLAALIAIWMMLGVMYAIYYPMYDITRWSLEHFEQAQQLLEEARERKAELEQTLSDLAHVNRELGLVNEKLEAMRLIAEEAQKTKSAFVSKVSHEFRTPLNMIIGLTDLLIETPDVYGDELSTELLEDLEIVHRNCEHLLSMINDVLDLSQTEMGRLTLHPEWVDLTEDIKGALTVVHPLLEKKGLALTVSIPDDLPKVYCDKTRIRQVILNLVSNAARYTEKGGITLQVACQNNDIVVNVIDTGHGIAPEDIDHIFDPFCQGTDNVWRDQSGSGLGLSISKQFIELHKGQIWVDSQPGIGSTFSFKLPITPPSMPITRPGQWISEDWMWLERTSWPKLPELPYKQRVVICDETGDLYPLFTHYFDEIEFIDTSNLSQTVQALQECPAHITIVNAVSPNNLGPMLEEARSKISDTPIIGCSLLPLIDHVLDAGAVDYLIKPVTQADLKEAIEAFEKTAKRILIVDDHPDIQQLFTRMLKSYDNTLEITTVSNGQQALQELRQRSSDLVLLDIVMPGMDGWQVLEQKSQDEAIKDIPVILVSAQDLATQPVNSNMLMVTIGEGLSVSKLMECSLQLSKLLLEPD